MGISSILLLVSDLTSSSDLYFTDLLSLYCFLFLTTLSNLSPRVLQTAGSPEQPGSYWTEIFPLLYTSYLYSLCNLKLCFLFFAVLMKCLQCDSITLFLFLSNLLSIYKMFRFYFRSTASAAIKKWLTWCRLFKWIHKCNGWDVS